MNEQYKGIFYNNNKWRHGLFSYGSVADVIAFAGHNMKYTVKFTDDDFIPLMKLKENSEESTSYMSPQGYVDPTSKYYIDRVWEEYHKVKEELADTKSKLGQLEDYISETLTPELADAKLKLKMAHSAWDELDKSYAERAKLHDELIIAEGQRDQAWLRAQKAERRVFEERTNRAFAVRAIEAERDDVIAICRGTQMDDAAITSMRKYVEEKLELEKLAQGRGDELGRCLIALSTAEAERDALLKVYEAAEVFVDMPRLVTESALRDAVTTLRTQEGE